MENGRDKNGRFVKGHKIKGEGAGRPPRAREERYYEITMSTVTFERWQEIVEKAAQQAARGNKDARKWLADYLVGVPEIPLTGDLHIHGLAEAIKRAYPDGND